MAVGERVLKALREVRGAKIQRNVLGTGWDVPSGFDAERLCFTEIRVREDTIRALLREGLIEPVFEKYSTSPVFVAVTWP